MESPLIYALNCIVSDAIWFVVACVPFWESKRIKKGTAILVLFFILAVRVMGAYLITAYTREWELWETCFAVVLYLVILTIYIAAAGAHPVKVVYIFLIIFIVASFSNMLAGFMVTPLIPAGRSPYDTVWYAAAISVLIALILPFLYRMFRVLMRRAFDQLPNRIILMLCFIPAVFFVLAPIIYLSGPSGSSAYAQAALSLVALAACYLNVYMMLDTAQHIQTENALALEKRLARESYGHISEHLREVAGLKHDMKKHLAAVQAYLEHGRTEEAQNYLALYAEQSASVTETAYSEHFLMNAIAGDLYRRAGENGIKAEVSLNAVPEHIADPDLYSLLSNLTDNAVEACMAVPESGERFIRLTVTRRKPYLNIRCVNSKTGGVIRTDGKIQTTKAGDGHGYGLWTIGRVVDAYEGMMNIAHDDDTFTVALALKDRLRRFSC